MQAMAFDGAKPGHSMSVTAALWSIRGEIAALQQFSVRRWHGSSVTPPRPGGVLSFLGQLIYIPLLMNFAAVRLVRAGLLGSITRGNLMLVDPA